MDNIDDVSLPTMTPVKRRKVQLEPADTGPRPQPDDDENLEPLPDLEDGSQAPPPLPPVPDEEIEHLEPDPDEYTPGYDVENAVYYTDPNQQATNENSQQQENPTEATDQTQNTENNSEFPQDVQNTIDEMNAAANGAVNDTAATNEQAQEAPEPEASAPTTSTKKTGRKKTAKEPKTPKKDRWGRAVQAGENINMSDIKGEEIATDDYNDMPPMTSQTCYEFVEILKDYCKENIRGTDNRHYARFDRNQTCTGDQHNYCLRRFILENWPICGLNNQPLCYYCKMMTPKARAHRISEAKKYLKHPNMIAPIKKWKRLHPSIKNNAMAFQLCVSRGMMYEFSEAVAITSKMPLRPTNYMNCHASTQTKISMAICGPHPENPEKKVYYNVMPPAEKQLRIWNTNFHAERFVYKEYAELYSDAIEWKKENDPGQFYMNDKTKKSTGILREVPGETKQR